MYLTLLLYALFAGGFIVSKVALAYSAPLFLIGSRMSVAGVLFLAYLAWRKKLWCQVSVRGWCKVCGLGLIHIYFVNALEFYGLAQLTSFKTCFIYSLSPFISALLCYILYGQVLTVKKWLGFVVGVVGFIPILFGLGSFGELWIVSTAQWYVVGAACLSCYGWILMKDLVDEMRLDPVWVNGMAMCIGGVCALIHSSWVETYDPWPVVSFWEFLGSMGLLMFLSNGLAYPLYGVLLRRYTATFLSFAGFTTPIFTALLGYFFLGETIDAMFIASCTVVFLGLWLFNQEELKEGIYVAA